VSNLFANDVLEGRTVGGRPVVAPVVNEHQVRAAAGLTMAMGAVGWMTRRQPPDWVSAKPKRFAWTLGLALTGAMTIITNDGIRGWLPRSICLVCLALMWLESVLSLGLGCETHGLLVRRGWARKDEAYEICTHGACDVTSRSTP